MKIAIKNLFLSTLILISMLSCTKKQESSSEASEPDKKEAVAKNEPSKLDPLSADKKLYLEKVSPEVNRLFTKVSKLAESMTVMLFNLDDLDNSHDEVQASAKNEPTKPDPKNVAKLNELEDEIKSVENTITNVLKDYSSQMQTEQFKKALASLSNFFKAQNEIIFKMNALYKTKGIVTEKDIEEMTTFTSNPNFNMDDIAFLESVELEAQQENK